MIGFAHRGAPVGGTRQNSLKAFTRALADGATALESDTWLTADGVPVLVHDGILRSGLRRRPLNALASTSLPHWLPTLDALYATTGGDFELSLDVKDPEAGPAVIDVARARGVSGRLWLCTSAAQTRKWRPIAEGAHLVVSTTLRAGGGQIAESRIEEAAGAGADALNLRNPEWTPERVSRCHSLGLLAFAWDVQKRATLVRMREYGCDAIYSDSVPLLTESTGPPPQ